jgi:hypothetical protein
MKFKMLIGIAVVALVVVVNSCENKSVPQPAVAFPAGCDTLNLTYFSGTNTMKTIIDVQCGTGMSSCHGAGAHYDYTTYNGIYANYQNGLLYQALFGNGSTPRMPLIAQTNWADSSTCYLAKFYAWMNLKAPN